MFDNVFGAHGLLRAERTTIILATHAGKFYLSDPAVELIVSDKTPIVHLLPHADNIIALGPEGKIERQGTFDALNAEGGYLSRFGLESNKEQLSSDSASSDTRDEGKINGPLTQGEPLLPKSMDDGARRLGDRSVYKYYFKTIGLPNTILFFFLLLLWVVMLKLPGKK